MYTENIIAIAKRENNAKRKFLVVNKYQGKHVPVSPDLPFKMFSALADLVAERCKGERLLLIGFAETATTIGKHWRYSLTQIICRLPGSIFPRQSTCTFLNLTAMPQSRRW